MFLGRRHKSCWTNSSQTQSCNKNGGFWSYFRDFVGVQKIEDLSESKNFFAEVFQIKSRFVLAKKILVVRCTLNWKIYSDDHSSLPHCFIIIFFGYHLQCWRLYSGCEWCINSERVSSAGSGSIEGCWWCCHFGDYLIYLLFV